MFRIQHACLCWFVILWFCCECFFSAPPSPRVPSSRPCTHERSPLRLPGVNALLLPWHPSTSSFPVGKRGALPCAAVVCMLFRWISHSHHGSCADPCLQVTYWQRCAWSKRQLVNLLSYVEWRLAAVAMSSVSQFLVLTACNYLLLTLHLLLMLL